MFRQQKVSDSSLKKIKKKKNHMQIRKLVVYAYKSTSTMCKNSALNIKSM